MAQRTSTPRSWLDLSPQVLSKMGVRSWLLLGLAGVAAIVVWGLSLSISIVIPLIIAIILGILFVPLVDWMERHRVPRSAGASITMLLILVIAAAVIWIVSASVSAQWPQIQRQISSGVTDLKAWVATLDLPTTLKGQVTQGVQTEAPKFGQGAANALFSGLSSVAEFLFGTFLALYMLFFTLKDHQTLREWIAGHLGVPRELGVGILEDSFASIRQYFQGTTVIAVVTTVATALGLWLIGVPLIAAISVVTFVMSYIPFFGAILSAAFAVLIALGTGGVPMAIGALVVVLLAQNVLQSVVQGWAIGSALNLHPLVVLIATTLGGIFGGLVGGMLGAPLAAVAVRTTERLKAAWAEENAGESPPSAATEPAAT